VKLALVTAGLHRLGAAISTRLAEGGWNLALHSRTEGVPDRGLAAALTVQGTRWHQFEADLSSGAAVLKLLDDIKAHFGCLPDLIVNNASRFVWDDASTITADELAQHFAVNLTAPVLLATSLAGQLQPDQTACVVNILDQRIRQPNRDQLSYTLSKQALSGATETLARALAPKVRVNAVAPGLTLPTEDYRPTQMVALGEAMPLRRLPEPEDVADAVLWLAGAQSTTGQTIYVDGGASMKSFERDFVFLGDPSLD
jgi:pteridine reductase